MLHSGRLCQQFLLDAFACVELNNLNFVRKNKLLLRSDRYTGLMDRLDQSYELKDIGKQITVLPSSHTGSPRYMKAKKQEALAVVRNYGPPTFFITFTCNPRWKEFGNDLEDGVEGFNRPDLADRVFRLKGKELLYDLTERHVMRQVAAHTYVIEFQKRGLPHAHILLVTNPRDRIDADNVDAVCAVIPDKKQEETLYRSLSEHMIHKNCQGNEKAPCHGSEGKCTKSFHKPELMTTDLTHHLRLSRYYHPLGPSIERA